MHISSGGKIGFFLALIFSAGTGATMVWPDDKWIGWLTMVVSVAGLIVLAVNHLNYLRAKKELGGNRSPAVATATASALQAGQARSSRLHDHSSSIGHQRA